MCEKIVCLPVSCNKPIKIPLSCYCEDSNEKEKLPPDTGNFYNAWNSLLNETHRTEKCNPKDKILFYMLVRTCDQNKIGSYSAPASPDKFPVKKEESSPVPKRISVAIGQEPPCLYDDVCKAHCYNHPPGMKPWKNV